MFESIQETIQTRNYAILEQYLQKISFFREAKFNLTPEQYQEFISQMEPVRIYQQYQANNISSGSLYVFFSRISFIRKKCRNRNSFAQQKKRSLIHNVQKTFQTEDISEGIIEIGGLQIFGEKQFLFGCAYHSYKIIQCKKSYAIKFSQHTIKESTINTLKKKYLEKVQFLLSFNMLKGLSSIEIQNHFSKFQFRIYSFDQQLYNEKSDKDLVHFLKKGQIQVNLNHQEMKYGYIVKEPTILGFEKLSQYQSGRCVTEKCCAYVINKEVLNIFVKKDIDLNFQDLCDKEKIENILETKNQLGQMRRHIYQKPSTFRKNQSLNEQKLSSLCSDRLPQTNKRFIAEYSCTIFNQKYSLFLQKKYQLQFSKKIKNSNLYEINQLIPHQPEMTQIKSKLTKIRLGTIQKLKKNTIYQRQNNRLRDYLSSVQNTTPNSTPKKQSKFQNKIKIKKLPR